MFYGNTIVLYFLNSNITIYLKLKIILTNVSHEHIYFKPTHTNIIFNDFIS